VVKPQGRAPRMTLAQKLKAFDPKLHGGEQMADAPVGKEFR
jgi:antitoxin MazE